MNFTLLLSSLIYIVCIWLLQLDGLIKLLPLVNISAVFLTFLYVSKLPGFNRYQENRAQYSISPSHLIIDQPIVYLFLLVVLL